MSKSARVVLALIAAAGLSPLTAQATIRNINVGNFFFSPLHTVANVGDTIQWTFVAGIHTTTSDGTSPKTWDSGNRSSGTFQIVINPSDGVGPFPYHCTIHPMMVDTIFVSTTNDGDGDGTPDVVDNCPFIANPSQVDADMDLFGEACDCDDTRTDVHPGATEVVGDGIDQDCSGADAVFCFNDDDGDTFGSGAAVIVEAGTCGAGQSASSGDCNDGAPSIHPGATEIVDDGIDQDCNGFDAVTCIVDADHDGFGTNAATIVIAFDGSCDAAAGESTVIGDCNDGNATINPGEFDIPNDGIDQDCSGSDATGSCCSLRVGDANNSGDDEPTIGDVSALIDAKFIAGDCTGIITCFLEADVNQSGGVNPICDDISIGDISVLIDYLFITGPTLGLPACL